MLRLRVIDSFKDLEALSNSWNNLLQRSLDNDVFSTWEWLSCWWKHFGKGKSLRVLVAEEDGEIVGIAPLALSRYIFLHVGKLCRIEFMGFPHADYNNFIILKKSRECVELFFDVLMEFSDWDLLDLRDIREESASADALRFVSESDNNIGLRLMDGTLCPYINLPNSVEVFVKGLSRNMRRNLRKRMKKLCRSYRVEFKTHRDFSSINEAMVTFFKLHQERWRSKRKEGAFSSIDFRRFHLDVAKAFDEKGWLDLHFLTVNDDPVAAAYTFNYNFKKYGYLTGFNPRFGKFGVGNLLKLHLVEDCIRKGFREYDLARDFEPYKADWAAGVRKNLGARLVRRGLFAKIYCWASENNFLQAFSTKIGAHLTATNG